MNRPGRGAPTDFASVLTRLARHCRSGGLDLLQPLQAGWYNTAVSDSHRLPDFGEPKSLVVLIGNTGRLWPALVHTLSQRSDLLAHSDPLDTYVEEIVDDLNICIDESYADKHLVEELKQDADEVIKRINGYLAYLRKCQQGKALA